MKRVMTSVALCLVLTLTLTGLAAAQGTNAKVTTKPGELDNPKDYSNDHQVPARPGPPRAPQITEDFEGGTPPAGWTVIDNEGSGVAWDTLAGCGEAGNFTNGAGDVACVSSDVAGTNEFDTELLTDTYNFCDATNAAMLFTANYQNLAGLDFFDVDASTDGGGSWDNLLSWNEDHGGFRAQPGEDVNLGLAAYEGMPDVSFRFHYYDPNASDFDWYIQVDDFVLDSDGIISAPGAGGACDVPAGNSNQMALLALLLVLGGAAFVALRKRTV